jgi:hypothetical protein
MPKGPKGEKRPADVVSNAVHVMRIATGDVTEEPSTPAMAAGVSDTLWTMNDIVALIDAAAPAPAKRGPYKKNQLQDRPDA